MKSLFRIMLAAALLLSCSVALAADRDEEADQPKNIFAGLTLRSLGPAFMSGRIADIAINPEDPSQWYVAVGSGNVWRTDNAGVTWTPIFDDQGAYSIGCVTLDPSNPAVVWVGTGENVGGRHVGYGDGIYRSRDGGGSWEHLGLKETEHIAEIIVHPDDPDVVWVAAQGPLWSKGGERGLYKTTDGGAEWYRTLGDDEWVGVTDILIDPRDPDRLYAATWQRHRNVAAYMGGGPGSGIHRSTDGGETWEKLAGGLPGQNMGKIGLALSPQNPDVLYAAIELDRRSGGVYRSADRGASWGKMSDQVGGGTGPHYYQELYASPHAFDRIYLAGVRMQVSDDGGKSFRPMGEQYKHVDNHALAFHPTDPDYLLAGCDGGLYESYDLAKHWRFIPNLPVTQFYKVAVDDAEPFYNVYGGTQDNDTEAGPSRTIYSNGIDNSDWRTVIGGDGHQPATEPGNPDIVYAEAQQGGLHRVDVTTGEAVFIRPMPADPQETERFNWDTPILVSPHSPTRIYYASQRVWRSDNRGDDWTAISGDLTRNQERLELPIMGQTWSWEEPWDVDAMSTYNTITSLAESPLEEGLIYAGTDDGLVQITEDGGTNWRKVEVGTLPGVPATAFVNDIKADLFDADVAYIALDNHKFGDFKPYLLKTTDRGRSWTSLRGNLPTRTLIWRVVQDHVKPELMFAGTEFGIYVTLDGGTKWHKLSGGVPTISFRDLAIQRREDDLVGATFGRGFYVLDDYSCLREVSDGQMEQEATLFSSRRAWWFMVNERRTQGADHYRADNPPFGAVFTYYLRDSYKTKKDVRKEKEKELREDDQPVTFPGWDVVEAERRQDDPKIWLTVRDAAGEVIRRIEGKNKKGFNRIAWDLRYPSPLAVTSVSDVESGWGAGMVAPGTYTVSLAKEIDGRVTELAGPVEFQVERLSEGALPSLDPQRVAGFWRRIEDLYRALSAAGRVLSEALDRAELLQKLLLRTKAAPGSLEDDLHDLKQALLQLEEELGGHQSKAKIGEKGPITIAGMVSTLGSALGNTYGPTSTQRRSLELAEQRFGALKARLQQLVDTDMRRIEQALREAGAPWIEGQPLP